MKRMIIKFLILVCVLFATTTVGAQTNLLLNGQGNSKTEHWHARGEAATVEEFNGDKVFVLRNGAVLQQYIQLTDDAIGKYALFIGRVSSNRPLTDYKPNISVPYLYMFAVGKSNAFSEGQIMRDVAKSENEWHTIYTIHQVTKEDAESLMKCFLYQRLEKDVQKDGSVMRFDDLGLYLFETEKDALDFAKTYK